MRNMLPFQKQPKIFAAFKAGYGTVSRHLYLLLFPAILDLFLLFSPRVTITELMQSIINRFTLPSSATPELVSSWDMVKMQMVEFFRYFSLSSFLRSYPVGVPSLFSSVAFERNPIGEYQFFQLQPIASILAVVAIMTLIGLIFAYLQYHVTAKAASTKAIPVEISFTPRMIGSWLLIPLISFFFVMLVIFPATLLISLIGALMPFFTSVGFFFLSIGILTLVLPVVFTPHLVILEKLPFAQALAASYRTIRLTNAKTSTFFFISVAFSYLTNMLWRIPADDSWMLLVGVIGHALISTIILTASFHFCLDARKSVLEFTDNQMPETNLA